MLPAIVCFYRVVQICLERGKSENTPLADTLPSLSAAVIMASVIVFANYQVNCLKLSGNYMYHLLQRISNTSFYVYSCHILLTVNSDNFF
jgi:hypothetical protein